MVAMAGQPAWRSNDWRAGVLWPGSGSQSGGRPFSRVEQLPLIGSCVLLHLLLIPGRVLLDERLILLDLLLVLRRVLLHLPLIGSLICWTCWRYSAAFCCSCCDRCARGGCAALFCHVRRRQSSPWLVRARPAGISPTHIGRRTVVGRAAVFVSRWRHDIGRARKPAGIAIRTGVIAILVATGIDGRGRVGADIHPSTTDQTDRTRDHKKHSHILRRIVASLGSSRLKMGLNRGQYEARRGGAAVAAPPPNGPRMVFVNGGVGALGNLRGASLSAAGDQALNREFREAPHV